ncbi:MAG: two-component sensor histidine kinase [Ponticaulis sp.]|nr:two-component sensor histidine kinase [Ponticaulis sp.]
MLRFRDITPRGFYARSLLIVLLPLVVLLITMTWFFFDTHIAQVSRKLSQSVSGEVAEVTRRFVVADPQGGLSEEQISAMSETLRLSVSVLQETSLPETHSVPFWRNSRTDLLAHELGVSLENTPYWLDTDAEDSQVDVRVLTGLEHAPQIRFLIDRKRTFSTTGHNFIVWVFLFSLLLIAIAIGFLRNQVKSVLRLAEAADAWGRGEDIGELRPSGATEVRQAARAISQMRERIIAHVNQRTAMLAGVSHDLRTPLTRLKLQLALLPPSEDKTAAQQDLNDMSEMLDEYLAFAKGEEGEHYQLKDISALAHEVAMGEADRAAISVQAETGIETRIRPLAVKRALANLVSNAADHGNTVKVTVEDRETSVVISVEDDGPGIDESRMDDAFQPFVRLDEARNQNTSGIGLGLALARDVARSHGGDIMLSRSDLGGLRAEFHLPLQTSAPKN